MSVIFVSTEQKYPRNHFFSCSKCLEKVARMAETLEHSWYNYLWQTSAMTFLCGFTDCPRIVNLLSTWGPQVKKG